jgi:hypothetical protein
MAEWLARLLRILEVPGSNFGSETDYPEMSFVIFFSPSKLRCNTSITSWLHRSSLVPLFEPKACLVREQIFVPVRVQFLMEAIAFWDKRCLAS